jgi:hypothetical protein
MASELPDECCANCRFWHLSFKTDFCDPDDKEDTSTWSQCRRFPPVSPVDNIGFWADGEPDDGPAYPLTHDYDWCGEFQPVKSKFS